MALQGSSCLSLLLLPLLQLHTSEAIKCYKCIGPVSHHCSLLCTFMQCTAPHFSAHCPTAHSTAVHITTYPLLTTVYGTESVKTPKETYSEPCFTFLVTKACFELLKNILFRYKCVTLSILMFRRPERNQGLFCKHRFDLLILNLKGYPNRLVQKSR